MFLPKIWSLSVVLIGTLIRLSHGRVLIVDAFHDDPSTTDAAIVPRASYVTEGGTIAGNYGDLLYTYGLATCVGMAATGDPSSETATNKVLGHISCGQNQVDVDNWITTVRNSGMANLQIVVSVVDPSLVDPGLRDAQNALNNYAFGQAQDLVPNNLNNIVKIIRTASLDTPTPYGTVRIDYDRRISAEGNEIFPSRTIPGPPGVCTIKSHGYGAGDGPTHCACPDGSCWMLMPNVPYGTSPCSPPLDVEITCPA